eukprot:1203570-Rhodomonas_salina.1
MQLVKLLPPGSKNYRIAADNLFNSVDTCRKVAGAGHRIYRTMRMDLGVPEKMKQKLGELKEKGYTAFVQSSADDLTLWAWMDSKVRVTDERTGSAVDSACDERVQHVDGSYQ